MGTTCDAIITDQAKAFTLSIEQLQKERIFDGFHFYDIHHIMKNIKIYNSSIV
jgi:hypothetical protein